ncbi:MAG: FhaA domain-containing protein [Dermatophilaceae bacterium]
MGRLQRIEQKLERAINGAFAKAFRAEVQPVEIASAVRRAMDERAQTMAKGRTFVPNGYTVELSPSDYERLSAFEDDLREELLAAAQEHAESQHYHPRGEFSMRLAAGGDLETGMFRIHPEESGKSRSTSSVRRVERDERPDGRSDRRPGSDHPGGPGAAEPADLANRSGHTHAADHEFPAPGRRPAPDPQTPRNQGRASGPEVYDWAGDGTHDPDPDPSRHDPTSAPAAGAGAGATESRSARGERAAYDHDRHDRLRPDPGDHDPAPGLRTSTRREPAQPRLVRATDRPWLEIGGEQYPLIHALTILGRDTVAQIVVPDANVSRAHCEVRVTSDGPHLIANIRDLGSLNGTWVNGARVTSARLQPRDRIRIGQTDVVFHAGRK